MRRPIVVEIEQNDKIMKKDILNSTKGIKLADEIIQIMRDSDMETSMDDYSVLKDAIENNEFGDELIEKICDEQYIADSVSSISPLRKGESLSQFSEKLNFKVKREERRKLTFKYSITIGITAAVAVISFLLFNIADTTKQNTLLSDRSNDNVEITVPTLIREDGEIIPLTVEEMAVNEKPYKENTDTAAKEAPRHSTIVVPSKFKFTIKLSDGSIVALNANSEMSYPSEFEGDSRKVKLKGEAFFIVSKSDKPFLVETDKGTIKVYGTRFNINLNRQDIMQVVLVEGSVGVTFREQNSTFEFMMCPRQLLEYNSISHSKLLQENVNVDNYISWIDGSFRYNHIQLSHLLEELSAWYGVEFESNRMLGTIYISLNVNRDMKLDSLLKILENMCNIQFTKEKGGLYRIN